MSQKKIVVIGGVAGGMSFATRYRRLNQDDHIIVFEKGPYVSFANCGLPYYISGVINSRQRLLVVKEKELVERFNLDIRSQSEVISIDPKLKQITYKFQDNVLFETYDELIISTGAKPIKIDILGLDSMPHFELRNIPDLDQIMAYIKTNNPKHATIIGAGYIGLEVLENLKNKAIEVALVEKSKEVLPILDYEMAKFARIELEKNGVDVYTDDEVLKIEEGHIHLKSNQTFKTDMIVTSIGVLPDTYLASKAGVKLGLKGGILVDHKYQTSIPHIHAVGDAIIVKQQINGKDSLISLASPANRQGRQLADILSGLNVENKGSIGTSIIKLFDLSIGNTGLNEKMAKDYNYGVIHLLSNNHASYYPNATPINLKVIFNKDDEMILGAQAIGVDGVDKRIDILATAIKAKLKVTDLQELELSYAPPYSSAKDIINLVGYVASNIINGITKQVHYNEVDALLNEGAIFVDVRNLMERLSYGYIKDSIHIDINSLSKNYEIIPKSKKIIVYCQSGTRSYNAETFLRSKGYDVYNLDGGYDIYGITK